MYISEGGTYRDIEGSEWIELRRQVWEFRKIRILKGEFSYGGFSCLQEMKSASTIFGYREKPLSVNDICNRTENEHSWASGEHSGGRDNYA